MKVKTSELIGAPLDWAVLEVLKPHLSGPASADIGTFGPLFGRGYKYPCWGGRKYSPSTSWEYGGPIIEHEGIQLTKEDRAVWNATMWWDDTDGAGEVVMRGPTLLVAAMRCYVAVRLGSEIDIPAELTHAIF